MMEVLKRFEESSLQDAEDEDEDEDSFAERLGGVDLGRWGPKTFLDER